MAWYGIWDSYAHIVGSKENLIMCALSAWWYWGPWCLWCLLVNACGLIAYGAILDAINYLGFRLINECLFLRQLVHGSPLLGR